MYVYKKNNLTQKKKVIFNYLLKKKPKWVWCENIYIIKKRGETQILTGNLWEWAEDDLGAGGK